MKSKSILAGLLIAIVMLSGWNAWSTLVVKMDTETLVRLSDVVLIGRVALKPNPFQEENGGIMTRVTLAVDEYLKASPALSGRNLAEVVVLGGTYNGITQVVPGMPAFRQNEKVLVFLKMNDATDAYGVVGLAQGKLQIRKDPLTGKEYVRRDLSGLYMLQPKSAKASQSASKLQQAPLQADARSKEVRKGGIQKIDLRDYVAEIKEIVSEIEASKEKKSPENSDNE